MEFKRKKLPLTWIRRKLKFSKQPLKRNKKKEKT